MGSPSELSLDYKQPATMKSSDGGFLKDVLTINDGAEKLTRLNEITKYLEEERRKIDGFKRELPLCMHLLNDAIEGLKEEARQCSLDGPVLEEFMPIKKKSTDEERNDGLKQEKDSRDKMNWMSSAQLWSNSNSNNNNNSGDVKEKFEETDTRSDHLRVGCENPKPFPVSKHRNGSGAFLPFKANSGFTGNRKEEKDLADLSLSPGIKNLKPSSKSPSSSATQSSSQQPQRKSRRCWSTELHRRFVNALQQLGGCQVATPKQIKELMKVDGLTNDEVKSHLQKYRLHTKRPNDSVTASSATNQQSAQVVLLGGIWVPHEYSSQGAQSYHVSKQRSPVQSGSPQGPLQLAGNNRGNSGIVDSGGDEEDGKSECYSWKGQHQRSGEETD